jgi:hypothetical protein
MGQLLAILIIPPLIGIITYAVFRFIWEKDEQADRVAPSRSLDGELRNGATASACNRVTVAPFYRRASKKVGPLCKAAYPD